ncbi:MAG: hypothetical protein K0B16_12520 [Burkholderiaceae bacterium]|nr:hypothetical protein [Burkholderiaceae bacterium]
METVNEAQRQMLDAATRRPLIAMLSLGACAMGGSEGGAGLCPPVVAYSRAEQARAAAEAEALPEAAVVVRMLADFAVMREQARACR